MKPYFFPDGMILMFNHKNSPSLSVIYGSHRYKTHLKGGLLQPPAITFFRHSPSAPAHRAFI